MHGLCGRGNYFMYVQHARAKGVWGHALPENFWISRLESISGAFLRVNVRFLDAYNVHGEFHLSLIQTQHSELTSKSILQAPPTSERLRQVGIQVVLFPDPNPCGERSGDPHWNGFLVE